MTKNNKSKIIYRLSWIILIIPYLFYAVIFPFLPNKIPAHADSNGIIDRWIDKTNWEVIIVCSIALFIALTTNFVTKIIMDSHEKLKETAKSKVLLAMSSIFVIINLLLMIYMYIYLPSIGK